MCCASDLGDSGGGGFAEGKQVHYTSILAYITPQRPVNEDSEEMRGPHPLLRKLLEKAPGLTCHL